MKTRTVRRILCSLAVSLALSGAASAQTWHVGGTTPGGPIKIDAPALCAATLYDPEVYVLPSGARALLGQGSTFAASGCVRQRDELFLSQQVTGGWSNVPVAGCPALSGGYATVTQCGAPFTSGPGPLGSPSIAKVGSKYFMAFNGGNSDTLKGHVFWATSTDGVTWTPFLGSSRPAGYQWKPLIYLKGGGLCDKIGVGHVSMVYDPSTTYGAQGAFYLYVTFSHPNLPQPSDHILYRFQYSSTDPAGMGGGMQVCLNSAGGTCQWTDHSGAMVFANSGVDPEPGDPVLPFYGSARNMGHGPGDIKWNPGRNAWLRAYTHLDVSQLFWQEATSLATGLWTAADVPVDTAQFQQNMAARFGALYNPADVLYPGLYYGSFGGGPNKMWIFQPIDYGGCSSPFGGLGIVISQFNYF